MIKTSFLILVILISSFSFIQPTYAQLNCPGPQCQPNPFTNNANTINLGTQLNNSSLGIQQNNSQGIVGTILRNVLILLFTVGGIGTVIYFIWGAVEWIMAGGDKEKVGNARKRMTQALVGLVLLALSFVIVRVVGEIVGFNPLETIQIRSLEDK